MIAFLITSAVIFPSDANFLSSPRDTPIDLAMIFSIIGAFSAIERNSSPCNCPLAKPCVNWSIAFFCASFDAPPIANTF